VTRGALLLAACLLPACQTVAVDRYFLGSPRGPSRLPGVVLVVPEGESAPWPYEEVAVLQVVTTTVDHAPATLDERLKREARLLGCDGLVRVSQWRGRAHAVGTAVAVVRLEAPPPPEFPPEDDK